MKDKKSNKNSFKFMVFALLVLAVIIGLVVFFLNKPSTQSDNNSSISTLEDKAFEESIKNVGEVKLNELTGEKALEIAEDYVAAVNDENWPTVEKYSKGMAKTIRSYKISEMNIVTNSKDEKYKYNEEKNEYIFIVDFSFGTQDEKDIKEISEGMYFIVKLVNGIVNVNPLAKEL